MKITVKNADLAHELNLLEKIAGKKPTIAVLANVLIQANMGTLILSVTDLVIGLVGVCSAQVEEPGSVTLPVKKLTELVRAQSSEELTMESGPRGSVTFTSGGFKSRLQALPAHDFPGIPTMEGQSTIVLPRIIGSMISQVRYAVSDKEQRYFMQGAYMALKEGNLLLVATDGSRLSVTEIDREGPGWEPVLVPAKALDELVLLVNEEGKDDITFAVSDRHLFFDLDGRTLISRQIDSKFPPYERIIPKDNPHKAEVDRLAFISVLKRVVLIDDIVALNLRENSLELTAASQIVGEGAEEVPFKYSGPEMILRYKGQYLLDFLTTAVSPQITMDIKGVRDPVLFTDGKFLNVILGMVA